MPKDRSYTSVSGARSCPFPSWVRRRASVLPLCAHGPLLSSLMAWATPLRGDLALPPDPPEPSSARPIPSFRNSGNEGMGSAAWVGGLGPPQPSVEGRLSRGCSCHRGSRSLESLNLGERGVAREQLPTSPRPPGRRLLAVTVAAGSLLSVPLAFEE